MRTVGSSLKPLHRKDEVVQALDAMPKQAKNTDSVQEILKRVKANPSTSAPIALAETLRKSLLELNLPEGTRLFGLADLTSRTGTSAGVVREAIQQLQSMGLIEVRQGSRGGIFTRRVDQDNLVRTMEALVYSNQIPREAVLESRRELEALCARIAANSASSSRISELRESVDRISKLTESSIEFAQENINFHMLVCKATENPVLVAIANALRELFFGKSIGIGYSKEILSDAVKAHQIIVDEIEKGNGDRAWAVMAKHVVALEKELIIHPVQTA